MIFKTLWGMIFISFDAMKLKISTCILKVNGQELTWPQIRNMYERDIGMNSAAPGLSKLIGKRISHDHISLNPRSRMRVNLAVQV